MIIIINLVNIIITYSYKVFFLVMRTFKVYSLQFSHSVVTLCDPMDCSMPGLPVHHQLPN